MTSDRSVIKVLHVDDEPDFAELAAEFIQRKDDQISVETAVCASDGVVTLAQDAYDCVVSDYDMPGSDGIDFLESVREEYPELPFILYTGKGSEEVASEAISAGVTDYLQKGSGTSQYEVLVNRIRNAVEQRRAREEAVETERRLRTIAENSNDILWKFTADWDELLFINSPYEEIWGRSVSELNEQPRSFLKGVHPDDRPEVETAMERLSAGDSVDFEFRVNADEDYGRWVWVQGEPAYVEDEVAKVVGFARDITDRKEREHELERTRYRYETLLESTHDAIAWVEFDGKTPIIQEANPAFKSLFAPPDASVEGADLDTLVASDDRLEDARSISQRVKRGESLEGEVTRDTVNGPREFRWHAVPVENPQTGEIDGGYTVYADITEQREHRRQLETTVEFLQQLYDVATNAALDSQEKITRLLAIGQETLDLPYGSLTRIEYDDVSSGGGTQTIIQASGNHELLQPGETSPLSQSYCRETIQTEGLFEVRDVVSAGWQADPAYELFNLGCYIGTKVSVDDELYGTVFFASDTPREEPFTAAQQTFVRLMSQLISYELEQQRLN